MSEDAAWYLIVRDAETNTPVGCVHFRFDIDCDDEVLYWYDDHLYNFMYDYLMANEDAM